MKDIISRAKMDINMALEYAIANIHHHVVAFPVSTQFGTIAFEVNRDYDMMKCVSVCNWDDAPGTKYVFRNRKADYQFYATVGYKHGQDENMTRAEVLLALANCMVRYITRSDRVSFTISNAVALAFIEEYHDYDFRPDAYSVVKMMMQRDTSKLFRVSKEAVPFRENLEAIIKGKFAQAKDVQHTAMERFNESFHSYDFGSKFYDVVMAIALLQLEEDHRGYVTGRLSRTELADTKSNIIFDVHAFELIKKLLFDAFDAQVGNEY